MRRNTCFPPIVKCGARNFRTASLCTDRSIGCQWPKKSLDPSWSCTTNRLGVLDPWRRRYFCQEVQSVRSDGILSRTLGGIRERSGGGRSPTLPQVGQVPEV